MALSIKQKLSWAAKNKRYLEGVIYVECMDRKATRIPRLEFGNDLECYTDHQKIHLGLEFFEAEDEKDLFWQVYYILGHELQHIKSTNARDWDAAIRQGVRITFQAIAKTVYGKRIRLVKDSDFERFTEQLKKDGYHISTDKIETFVHFICNSLEDGRVENIRCQKHHAFRKYMVAYRAKSWETSSVTAVTGGEVPELKNMNAAQKLYMILNQILSLSANQLYQKEFLKYYGDTQLQAYIVQFYPNIRKGISAKTCRECMVQASHITEILADMIAEASQMDEFEQLMEALKNAILSALNSAYSASSGDEETGDGSMSPVFGGSPLDESEDAESNSEPGSGSGPAEEKDDEKPKKKSDSKNGGTDDGDESEDGENGKDSQEGSGSGKDKKDEKSGKSETANGNAESENTSSDEKKSENQNSKRDAGGKESNKENRSDQSGNESSDSSGSENSSPFTGHPEGCTALEDEASAANAVTEAMQEAAESETPEEQMAQEDIEKQSQFANSISGFKTEPPEPIDTADIDAEYPEKMWFDELTREYKPDLMLPVELENKGNALKRKIEDVLKRRREPDKRGMRSGTVDGPRLYSLIFSDTSCFKRNGEEKKPDAAVFLLQDNSGSMGYGPDSNRYWCCNAMAIAEQAFKDIVPLKIAAFDARSSGYVIHEIIKDFDEKAPCSFSYNFLNKGRSGWGNKDGYSIRIAARQLLQRPEQDKILLVASDGLPSAYSSYEDGIADVHSAVEEARKAGITVIGMYMYQDQEPDDAETFKSMYAPNSMIVQLDDLEDELARVLKIAFLKG